MTLIIISLNLSNCYNCDLYCYAKSHKWWNSTFLSWKVSEPIVQILQINLRCPDWPCQGGHFCQFYRGRKSTSRYGRSSLPITARPTGILAVRFSCQMVSSSVAWGVWQAIVKYLQHLRPDLYIMQSNDKFFLQENTWRITPSFIQTVTSPLIKTSGKIIKN